MSRQTFENYGVYAENDVSFTRMAGRYSVQAQDERNIVADVRTKLALNSSDTLLEIGCGVGNVLIPLSFSVAAATGVDHPKVVERFARRFNDPKIRLIGANFLDLDLSEKFTKILFYSMLQQVTDEAEARACLFKALDMLEPGGMCLVADMPNEDKKDRFLATEAGKAFLREWNEINSEPGMATLYGKADHSTVSFNDKLVLSLLAECRAKGFETYLLPQPANLPFGRTREDLLICKLAE